MFDVFRAEGTKMEVFSRQIKLDVTVSKHSYFETVTTPI